MTEDKLHSIVLGVLLACVVIEIGRHHTWKTLFSWTEKDKYDNINGIGI